jgi:transposase
VPSDLKYLTVEEGPLAAWIARTLNEYTAKILICDPRKNSNIRRDPNKNDHRDTCELSRLLWLGELSAVYHPQDDERAIFKAAAQQYLDLRKTQINLKCKLKAKFRSWGVPDVEGTLVYGARHRSEYLDRMARPVIRHQLQRLYDLLDEALRVQEEAFQELQHIGQPYPEIHEFTKIPGVGPVGAHIFDAFIQTPDRFADKQKVWRYCQIAVTDRSSDGKPLGYRRLDRNGNSELKALSYWAWKGAIHCREDNEVKRFYQLSLERTHDRTHARLNTQRKIIAAMWSLWKRKEAYQPERFLNVNPNDTPEA